jgi:hypothetical protein
MQVERVVPGRGWWLLGPQPVAELGGPVREVTPGRWLSVAPGLGVVSAESSRVRVTLVGYALDPDDAGVSDAEVASVIAQGWDGPASLPVVSARFGGRWMVVVDDGRSTFVGQDTFGMRRVLYGPDGWCSGSELVLHRHGGFGPDPLAEAFVGRLPARGLPVWTTRVAGVRRLLPSQVLDLGSGEPVTVPLVAGVTVPTGPEACLESAARSMAGVTAAAARRAPLVVLLSGGADSRVVLAACRGVTDRVRFVTIDSASIGGAAADVRVARRLAGVLGLDHVVVEGSATPSAAFAAVVAEHTLGHDPLWTANNEAVSAVVPAGAVGVSGHLGELWRGTLAFQEQQDRPFDADRYLALRHHTGDALAEGPTRAWFAAADRGELPFVHRLMWELDFTDRPVRWAEATDPIWADYLSPFGSRSATAALFSLPAARRDAGPALFEDLARRLWPEALEAELLPKVRLRHRSLPQRLRSRMGRALHR